MPNSALMDTSWKRKRRRRLKLRAEGIAKINPDPDRMLYPLTFHPIFKERVWGGRKLEQIYHKPLPAGLPIGESWELSDRPGDISVIANGPLAGKDLHWLVEHHRQELLGTAALPQGRVPLLVKTLEGQGKLCLEVHP